MLRAALDKMVAGGTLPTPQSVTAAPPGKDLLEWWDSVSVCMDNLQLQRIVPGNLRRHLVVYMIALVESAAANQYEPRCQCITISFL